MDLEIDGKDYVDSFRTVHTFRAVSDGVFVHQDTMKRIQDGHFAERFKSSNMAMIIGEVEKEVGDAINRLLICLC
jgi:hypothetical protein